MRRHRPPERPSAAGIRIKSPRARFDRLSGRISGTRTDTPPSGSSPRRRKATQRGLSKRPRFPRIRGRFFAPEFPAAQVRHPLIPPAPQDSSPPPRRRRLQFRAHGTAGRNSEPAEPQVAPSPQRLKSRQSPQRRKSRQSPQRRRLHQAHGASSRTKPTAPQVAPKPAAPQVATKPSAPQVRPCSPAPQVAPKPSEPQVRPCSPHRRSQHRVSCASLLHLSLTQHFPAAGGRRLCRRSMRRRTYRRAPPPLGPFVRAKEQRRSGRAALRSDPRASTSIPFRPRRGPAKRVGQTPLSLNSDLQAARRHAKLAAVWECCSTDCETPEKACAPTFVRA